MAGRSALWFWVVPCCFPPPPCGFLSLITNLVQFQGQNFASRIERLLLWAHVIQRVVVALFREPIKWLVFDIQTRVPFWVQISFILQCFENLYREIYSTSKRKRNTLKGFVIRSSLKKQFVQQREIPKKAMSGKRADRSFLFSNKTHEEWNSLTALFPITL